MEKTNKEILYSNTNSDPFIPPVSNTSSCISKTFRLMGIILLFGAISGIIFMNFQVYSPELEQDVPNPYYIQSSLFAFGFLGILFYLVALFNQKKLSSTCAFGFSVCQGIVVGGLCSYTWSIFPVLIVQSITLTGFCLSITWYGYQKDIFRVPPITRGFIHTLVMGVCFFYMFTFLLYLITGNELEIIYGNTWTGIAFSIFVAFVACLETLICLQEIAIYEKQGISKEMEWFFALELISGIIWVYVEVIILLFKWNMKTEV